ncbi:MAG: hypothetical protein GX558_02300 [Clostridiales bacterium]|nr:hypothetical protein [Clostridiales bacterium]
MDQDHFYDDERDEREPVESAYDYGEDNGDLDKLFGYLIDILNEATPVPFSNKRKLNVDACLDIVNDIRNNLPEAVLQAERIVEEEERILGNAEETAATRLSAANARADSAIADAGKRAQQMVADAEDRARKIVEDAEMRARAMIEQSEITRQARELASKINNDALAEANEQRRAATRYAEELLRDLERDVQATLDAVRRSRQNIGGKP